MVHLKAGGSSSAMEKRWEQYQKLSSLALRHRSDNLVLLGDFNTTGYNLQNEDYEKFEGFMSKAGLVSMSEDIECTSYWHGGTDNGGTFQPSLLDHIVVQKSVALNVEEIKLGAHCAEQECRPTRPEVLGRSFESVSDHCPLQVRFK